MLFNEEAFICSKIDFLSFFSSLCLNVFLRHGLSVYFLFGENLNLSFLGGLLLDS